MRVVCDNCGATYKIPEHKLSREVNKATCRKCGHTIIIRRPGSGGPSVSSQPALARPDGDSTQISSEAELRARAAAGTPPVEEYVPPTVIKSQAPSHGDQTMPRADVRPPTPQRQAPPPVVPRASSQAPTIATPQRAPVAGVPLPQPKVFDPSGDLTLVMAGCFAAIVGSCVMAASMGPMVTLVGLGLTLAASITSLMVLITGDRGRKAGSMLLSMFLGLALSGAATAGLFFSGLMNEETPPEPALAAASTEPAKPAFPTVEHTDTEPAVQAEPDKQEPAPPSIVDTPKTEPARLTEPPKTEPKSEPKVSTPKTQPKVDTPRVEPRRAEPKVSPKTEPKSSGPVGVPVTVLDTMLKSNKGVKTCFGKYRQETGSLPSGRITVRITVQPSGRATSARIAGGAYASSSLDSCLGGAIKNIQFPPWDGSDAATYNYPFIL